MAEKTHRIEALGGKLVSDASIAEAFRAHYGTVGENKPEETYCIGDLFVKTNNGGSHFENTYFILGHHKYHANNVTLLHVNYHNRWSIGCVVKNEYKITEDEFKKMCCGGNFVRVKITDHEEIK